MPIEASPPILTWAEEGTERSARWRSEAGNPPPKRVIVADDTLKADVAYRLACEGTGILWRGDFHNARQLLQALGRRLERKAAKAATSAGEAFHRHRQNQAQRANVLNKLLIPLAADYAIPLRRSPDWRAACTEVWGHGGETSVVALRELLGLNGAHEWRKKGVPIVALGASIHPWYGVFSPVRGEYLDLIASAPLPSTALAFDIGTGTGVIAALLARRGVDRIVATDQDPRAIGCARENLDRLGYGKQVEIVAADLFPPGQAPLVVCNPPWLPARPSSPVEAAVYDPDSRMLRGFLSGLAAHLAPGGEGWLIISDLAERLGLRGRDDLPGWIAGAGLRVIARLDARPTHKKAGDASDPLYAARSGEITSLWRLAAD